MLLMKVLLFVVDFSVSSEVSRSLSQLPWKMEVFAVALYMLLFCLWVSKCSSRGSLFQDLYHQDQGPETCYAPRGQLTEDRKTGLSPTRDEKLRLSAFSCDLTSLVNKHISLPLWEAEQKNPPVSLVHEPLTN